MEYSAQYMRDITDRSSIPNESLTKTKDKIMKMFIDTAEKGFSVCYIADYDMENGVRLKEIRSWIKGLGYKVSWIHCGIGEPSYYYIKVRW